MMLQDKFRGKIHRFDLVMAYIQIVLGCIIGGVAYPLFLVPNSIAPGGLSGLAMVLNHLFHWPVGMTSLLMNIPLFLIGYKAMGRVFVWRSLVATVLFSLARRHQAGAYDGGSAAGHAVRRTAAGRGPGADPPRRRHHRRHGYDRPHGA